MFLFRDVLGSQLLDREGDKSGRVEDILFEPRGDGLLAVRQIVSGAGSYAGRFPPWMTSTVSWFQKLLLGAKKIELVTLDWSHVTAIDVAVHLDVDRRRAGLTRTEDAIWQRWLCKLPWAER